MLTELNFRPADSLFKSGYTVQVEVGDLAEQRANKTIATLWHDQVMRVTVTSPSGEVSWKIFRGADRRVDSSRWVREVTSGALWSL